MIRLSYPPSKLGQTGGGWRGKAALVKKWRIRWGWEFLQYRVANSPSAIDGVTKFKISFAPPDKRRRDIQNCQAAFKAGIDAMSEQIGIDDSKFKIHWTPEFLPMEKGGAVYVEVLG